MNKKKTTTEKVPALVLATDNEVKGKMVPAGTVIFIGECAEGLTIKDVNKAIARGNVKAEITEVSFEDPGAGTDVEKGKKDEGGSE